MRLHKQVCSGDFVLPPADREAAMSTSDTCFVEMQLARFTPWTDKAYSTFMEMLDNTLV